MRTIIIGAGFAGLTAARFLKDFLVLEKEGRPGGLCRTEVKAGFTFDYTGHLMHLRDKKASAFILKNSRCKMLKLNRKSYVFSRGVYTDYPYQTNNRGLPPAVIAENLTGLLEAERIKKKDTRDFKRWALSVFGGGICRNFIFPYNGKLWRRPLEKLTVNWMGRFLPGARVEDYVRGLGGSWKKEEGYNASFYYPERGGIESVIKGLARGLESRIRLNAAVKRVDLKKRVVYTAGSAFEYDRLISTMPLKELALITGDKRLAADAKKLSAVSVYCLNVGYKERTKHGMHWIYVPEKKYPFYRAGFPSNFSKYNAPEGCASAFAEVSYNAAEPKGVEAKVINGLLDMGIMESRRDIMVKLPMRLKGAYVVYDRAREAAVSGIKAELKKHGVITASRWGNWEYSSMEDAVIEGMEAAEEAKAGA
ncbi:MAG TPA: hypothetical protein ENN43_04070 [bacterium]|nr:hypothetical protein [bacterium]